MKIFVVVCAVFFSLLNGCKSDEQESALPNVLNIIVILDTSDRVSHPGQIERDIEIVKVIVTQFEKIVEEHINRSEKRAYKDSLTVVVPDQQGVPAIPLEIIKKLTITDRDPEGHKSTHGPSGVFTDLTDQTKALPDAVSELYEFVEQHPQTGSDIWKWFKYAAKKDYFGKDRRNLIICLSDGYLNFDRWIEDEQRLLGTYMRVRELRDDPHWKQRLLDGGGLKPTGEDLGAYNVKFLMLEIVPQKDGYQNELDIIEAYWDTWLNSMEIKGAAFLERDSGIPYRKIESFISGESSQR